MFQSMRGGYRILIALAVVQSAMAIALGQSGLWQLLGTSGLVLMTVSIGSLFPLIWISNVAIRVVHRRFDRPSMAIWRMIRWERDWLLRGALLAAMVVMFARSFSSFKSSISRLNGFWADPWFVKLDYLTFGTDPWRLTHAVFGPFGTLVLDRVYIFWFFMMFLTLGWFCFTRNPKLQVRGLLSYLLCWSLLGGVTAVAFSSVGPCFYLQFYGDDRFAPLMANLNAAHSQTPLFAARSTQFLIDSLGKDRLGAGISAMPSLHVTIAALSFLAVRRYSKSLLLKIVSGLFAAAIAIGSVHLGWHYAWDGIVGIAGACLFWWGSGKFVDWVERRELSARPESAFKALPATP